MTKTYVVKEKENRFVYSDAIMLESPESLKIVDHPIRLAILKLLAKRPMYPAEIAKELRMHEQKVYYHMKQMQNSGILDISEKKEIRGTVAKKFSPRSLNLVFSLQKDWRSLGDLIEKRDTEIIKFLGAFSKGSDLDSYLVVGSPDPHGPFKARARDGHYAIDLALFLGRSFNVTGEFVTKLDVDIDPTYDKSLIVVGGPVTNLVCGKMNDHLPARFSDRKPWGIQTKRKTYTDDSVGLIAKIPNPFNRNVEVIVIAGIRSIGTKSAVLALTRHTKQVLYRFTSQKEFYSIVQGFDLDGDGKIDSIEVLE